MNIVKTNRNLQAATTAPKRLLAAVALLVVFGVFGGPSYSAATNPAGGQTPIAASESGASTSEITQGADAAMAAVEPSDSMADTWGVEITSIRLTAHDHMIDFRYKVLDAAKAGDLFKRQTKPALIHQETGKVLVVPSTAKLGPLRNSDIPKQDKIYWMFFGNGGNLVKAGDKVTVVIGDFRAEDLVVE